MSCEKYKTFLVKKFSVKNSKICVTNITNVTLVLKNTKNLVKKY